MLFVVLREELGGGRGNATARGLLRIGCVHTPACISYQHGGVRAHGPGRVQRCGYGGTVCVEETGEEMALYNSTAFVLA